MRLTALLVLPLLTAAQDSPVFRVPVRLVTAPTLVLSEDGRCVNGLKKSDFRVYDNGRLQDIRLDEQEESQRISLAVAIQANRDVREYLPFVAKVGSAIDALLAGASGESAVLTYNDEVKIKQPFGAGDLKKTLSSLTASGRPSRMVDAGLRAVELLRGRPESRSRILLFIGQPMDSGSAAKLDALKEVAGSANVAIYALTLPEFGKSFISDTFWLQGLSSQSDRGGFKVGTDLSKLVPTLSRAMKAGESADPYSILTAATGGVQLHFRKQEQLERAISIIGTEARSRYLLSYGPDSHEPGFHTVKVEVDIPGARVFSRPGYELRSN